ncbi:MAG: Fic family protein [Micrococcales bacterium]|nr:Fic family protein [Micrococcales bacterium]MCL2668768.1 Fic family protein [Micrococcales bacterium]
MAKPIRTWDDYYVPGTTVLRNLYGYTDQATLTAREEYDTAVRLAELAARPIKGRFDYAHMKAIHRHIFQDVYPWAGKERVGPVGAFMTKDGPDVVRFAPGDPDAPTTVYAYYPAGAGLRAAAEEQYARLAAKDLLRGLEHKEFVTELAEVWGELNVIHSFREGNTRTQAVFFSWLAEQAGYRIATDRMGPGMPLRDRFVAARFYSQATGDNAHLVEVLAEAVEPISPQDRRAPRQRRTGRQTKRPGEDQ